MIRQIQRCKYIYTISAIFSSIGKKYNKRSLLCAPCTELYFERKNKFQVHWSIYLYSSNLCYEEQRRKKDFQTRKGSVISQDRYDANLNSIPFPFFFSSRKREEAILA